MTQVTMDKDLLINVMNVMCRDNLEVRERIRLS